MAKRYVRWARKDAEGDITDLCNYGQAWSPRSKVLTIKRRVTNSIS